MNERMMRFPVDGTAALSASIQPKNAHTARIIEFSVQAQNNRDGLRNDETNPKATDTFMTRIRTLVLASEMYCSLVLEDARGVAYNLFSKKAISALAAACFVVATFAIAFGA